MILHNSYAVITTYLSGFAIVGGAFTPVYFFGTDEWWTWPLFIVALVLLVAFMLITKPTYAAFELKDQVLYVTTDKEDDDASWLSIPLADFVDYEIYTSFLGLRKTIVFYKVASAGYQRSRPTNISLYSSAKVNKLKAFLTPLCKPVKGLAGR